MHCDGIREWRRPGSKCRDSLETDREKEKNFGLRPRIINLANDTGSPDWTVSVTRYEYYTQGPQKCKHIHF